MNDIINDKLAAALYAEAEATNAHAQAAVAVENGTGTAADLTKPARRWRAHSGACRI
jgi:hypothetical protein